MTVSLCVLGAAYIFTAAGAVLTWSTCVIGGPGEACTDTVCVWLIYIPGWEITPLSFSSSGTQDLETDKQHNDNSDKHTTRPAQNRTVSTQVLVVYDVVL